MRLVAGIALWSVVVSAPSVAQPVPTLAPGETLLSIEAEGVQAARPDVMTITAGATTTGATAQAAVRANAELVARLVVVVQRSGIDARDVRTARLSVRPRIAGDRNRDEDTPPRILGYVANNELDVRFRDLTRASDIIEALFAAGANSVNGPTFSLSDPVPTRRAAERMAIMEARAEAANYAAALGKRVGRVVRVADRQLTQDRYGSEIVVIGSRISRTPIEPGEIETRVSVYVDFALVDP